MTHRWQFFRAGGVDQVSLRNGDDLRALKTLDQKLWVALAMPMAGVDIDLETLTLLDHDHDSRIRVKDILDAVTWCDATFKSLDDVLQSADEVKLSAIKDDAIVAAAKRMLSDLKKSDATSISVADTSAIAKSFSETVLNGDAIVIPESTEDADARHAITDIIATGTNNAVDRSGKAGVDQAHADTFFAAVDQRVGWLRGQPPTEIAGVSAIAASEALRAVREKLEDHFTRCRVAAFDPRGAAALGGQDVELVALATRSLSATDEELAKLPLGKVEPTGRLPLGHVNPAWAARMQTFATAVLAPMVGAREAIVAADLAAVVDKLAVYDAWRASEPKTLADALDAEWLEKLANPAIREQVRAVIAADAALAGEYDRITSVAKLVRLQRDFGRILRNFVNFSDFYSARDNGGTFQAGTLYLDARALHLCVFVNDAGKHAALATASDSLLLYCDLTRKGEAKQIACALTNGDADNIFIGRNGIFYDAKDQDWDATITKVIQNPISIREAFWTPYKKVVKVIEDNVTRRAAAADAASNARLEAVGKTVATAGPPEPPPDPKAPAKKIDLGTVAAIGVAIGGIGTLFGALLATMFGLGAWLPVGIFALMLLISGPAMVLAWLKLRRRNLGPILDANGWAINGRARINVAFGAAMTELARLPKGSQRSLDDPFADKRTPWRRWVVLAVILLLAGSWYIGKLDDYLPNDVKSITVLGEHAPAAPEPPAPAPAPAPAPEPQKK